MKDILINKHYRVDKRIGQGGFGLVYLGTDVRSGKQVAIKLQPVSSGGDELSHEVDIYEALSGGVGVPRVWWSGQECDFDVMITDLLGPSLEDLFNYCARKFSLKTVLLLADQLLCRIKYVHSKSFIYRDVKPENFLMGSERQGNVVHIVDFGVSKEFDAELEQAQGNGAASGLPLGGTVRYASLRNHRGLKLSWVDDLESLGYMLIYFARGSLPWQGIEAATTAELEEKIGQQKASLSGEELCRGLPDEFARYIDYTRSLRFGQKPDYSQLRQAFRRLFSGKGFKYDYVFDWTERRFNELHNVRIEEVHRRALRTRLN